MYKLRPLPNARFLLLVVLLPAAFAQNATTPPKPSIKEPAETLVVLGSAVPVPLAESQRSIEVLPVQGQSLAAESPQEFLREDSSIFLEERGAGGGQADIVMRGGSFEQTLVLLNGFRISDAQTSHHNLDLPMPLDAIDSIQALAGAGSTLHGVDALSGVVDVLTAAPDHDGLFLRAGQGSFESNEETLVAGATRGPWSGRVAAERNFSTGFMADRSYAVPSYAPPCTSQQNYRDCQDDRDYRNEDASAESWNATRLGVTDLLFASSDRSFGANQFYGDYNSWERTKGWFASARQELGSHTVAAFGYRRHTDDYVLLRNDPAAYENNHIDGSWQGSLRETLAVRKDCALLMGLEADGDNINSYNFSNLNGSNAVVRSFALGLHARNRGAGYVDLDLRPAKQRWSLSAGAREEIFSGGAQAVFSPELAGSLRVANSLKLRGSGGYGFRIPTYTDLYYSDPSTLGNPHLKPESAWSSDGGADWTPSTRLMLSATGFYSRQHDTIDYVRSATPNAYLPASCEIKNMQATGMWCADNLNGFGFSGVEVRFTWIPGKSQTVRIAWTGVHGAQSALHGLESEYVFNYPVQNIHASWSAALGRDFVLTNAVQIAQRYQQTVYPVWNATITHDAGKLRPYLRLTNLSNTGYQEIVGVNMPSRTIMGGFALQIGH
ncbi:MAG: TonB-dependent receptor [Terracidiphilus sp.]|jgi:iron complex outermembrane receptor protein